MHAARIGAMAASHPTHADGLGIECATTRSALMVSDEVAAAAPPGTAVVVRVCCIYIRYQYISIIVGMSY
jgi:hypothetical protein